MFSIRHGPWINELKNRKINLSDSGHKLGGKIEILLGADVAGKLLTRTVFYFKSGPVAIKTKLGWTLMGNTYRNETKFDKNHFMNVTSTFVNDMCISDLWKLDSLGITDPVETKTKLEIQNETLNHFQKTISVDISGRYEIALPWVMDNKLLSSNRKLAENRLESTKRKLIATGKFEEYQDVLDLWLSGKIIEEVNDDKENFVHYLPHRPVIKENSTSKIRPVFDASARTKGSPSLNDCLEKSPNFIEVIPTILNRFRKYKIWVISDIEKAFLQIGVREQDRDFLRFMWYDREYRDHIKIYRHRRVVFGVTSSPFLLGATLNLHLELEGQPDNFETMVLGLIWNLKDDCLSCNINCQKNEGNLEILKLKWDENLPKDILNQVKKWLEQLHILASIKIPRYLNLSSNGIKRLTLHVFCDASKKAYAACVFLRVEYEENVFVKLIQAKARVAPLKDISIPRLELLACVWEPDLRLLVKEIRNLSDVSSWEHVPSEKNFADILSRGCNAQQLVYLRWWEGPSWLSESPVQCPRSKQVPDEEKVNLELRKSVLVNTAKRIEEFNWYSKYFSSYLKVVRMIAWIFRFFKIAKRIDVCNTSEITLSEFDHAEKTVIKLIQMEKFGGVTDEKLRPLKPSLDEFGILRARTKLSFREDTHNFKFPIILPNEHPVVHLMIVRKREELMHAGVSTVMNHLRERFWILKTRKLIRQIIQKCTRCKRFLAQKTEVVPSSLPKDRVSNSKIFQVLGVDLAGPLHLKDRRKGWVVSFTCAVFRAVHFELITSLSTAAFLQSLRRFISRRGRTTIIYSDNGTNFVGSNSALNSIDWDVVISKANIQK
ncbi:integrase catalytic domain-containing protein [Trichonephila clavipes]|nr:integrase catalytic domain-containing protein [Trichonephila clavipes]